MTDDIGKVGERLDNALSRLHEVAQGRIYNVGTRITYRGKFGIVTDLNQGSEDPAGSTVDLRLEDGSVVESVSVTSVSLQLLRS